MSVLCACYYYFLIVSNQPMVMPLSPGVLPNTEELGEGTAAAWPS